MQRDEAAMRRDHLARTLTRPMTAAAALLAALLAAAGATHAAAQACRPDDKGVPVCGDGRDAVRVIADTISPSGRFAFAWGGPDGILVEQGDPDTVRTVLVRLADGATLATLGGQYWETQKWRANREELLAVWAPGERGVVEIANNRWATYSLAWHTLAADGASRRLDLLKLVEGAARNKLRPGKGRSRDEFSFHVSGDPVNPKPIRIDARGRLRFVSSHFIMKTDIAVDFDTVVELKDRGGVPQAEIVSLRRRPR